MANIVTIQSLRVDLRREPCIRLTQENSIESFLQSHLSYIPILMVYAYYCAVYPKWSYVRYKVNM